MTRRGKKGGLTERRRKEGIKRKERDGNFSTVYPLFSPKQEPEFQAGLHQTVQLTFF